MDLENYRPISDLSVASKIMEREVHKQLMDLLEEGKLISPFQFGFQRGKSTELAAISLFDNITGEKLVQRPDDAPAAFTVRMERWWWR